MSALTRKLTRLVVALSLAAAAEAAPAEAVVLDFGNGGILQPPTFAPPYVEDGFRFSTINQAQPGIEQDHFDIYDISEGPGSISGEREGQIHTGNDGDEVIIDFFGVPFALSSMDIEELDNPSSGVWEIVASNGTTLTFGGTGTINFDSNWSSITQFTLRSTSVPDVNDFTGLLTFDNITVGAAVPEPGSVSLMASGLGLLLARLRRRVGRTA